MHPIQYLFVAIGSSLPASIAAKATLIVAVGLLGARLARRSSAATRHALLAATFGALLLLPAACLMAPPVRIAVVTVRPEHPVLPSLVGAVDSMLSLKVPGTPIQSPRAVPRSNRPSLSTLLTLGWLMGAALSLIPIAVGLWKLRLLRRTGLPWAEGQAIVDRLAAASALRRRIEVLLHESVPGPIASGVLHPAIVLPPDAQAWERDDLNRALRHEMEHVRRGDCMTHSLGRTVRAMYWFHPLVWVAWRQIGLEAERACDDVVIAHSEATAYATQLVALAQRLMSAAKSPHLAMANRADLPLRVSAVLDSRQRRGRAGTVLVALGCSAAAVLLLTISPLRTVPAPRAALTRGIPDSANGTLELQAVSIKPSNPDAQGRTFNMRGRQLFIYNATLAALVEFSYGVQLRQIVGGPDWMDKDKFNVIAEENQKDHPSIGEWEAAVQELVAGRFGLKFHHENRLLPVYLLSVAENGPKLTESDSKNEIPSSRFQTVPGGIMLPVVNASMEDFVNIMQRAALDRPMIDQTGLPGRYNFLLTWAPDQTQFTGSFRMPQPAKNDFPPPNLFTALQQQVGLKLEPSEATMDVLVIDHVEQPSANQLGQR